MVYLDCVRCNTLFSVDKKYAVFNGWKLHWQITISVMNVSAPAFHRKLLAFSSIPSLSSRYTAPARPPVPVSDPVGRKVSQIRVISTRDEDSIWGARRSHVRHLRVYVINNTALTTINQSLPTVDQSAPTNYCTQHTYVMQYKQAQVNNM